MLKFVKKAKEIKGDPIQEKLLDSEAAIMDEDGNMIVEEGRSSLDFIPVASFKVASVTMRNRRIPDSEIYGEAVNCRQRVTTTVELDKDKMF